MTFDVADNIVGCVGPDVFTDLKADHKIIGHADAKG
jgi:hypothetical protein